MSDGIDGIDTEILERAINRTLGERVKSERRRLRLTLQELANRSGLSLGMVSKVENAQASPSLRTLARLAHGLDVPVTTFFRGLEEERDASFVKGGEGIELVRQGTRHGHRYELLAAPRGPRRQIQPFLVTLTKKSDAFGVGFVTADWVHLPAIVTAADNLRVTVTIRNGTSVVGTSTYHSVGS